MLTSPLGSHMKQEWFEMLGWSDIGINREHRPGIQDGRYIPPEIFEDYRGEFSGTPLVLEQRGNREELPEWHLN